MFNKILIILFCSLLLLSVSSQSFAGNEKNLGLMIIAHGSPKAEWNTPVISLEKKIKDELKNRHINSFSSVRVALMEFTEPSVSTIARQMEEEGIVKIYALPLFIAPSSHTLHDLPSILGHYFDENLSKSLSEEFTQVVKSNVRITLGPTLNYGNILEKIMLERLLSLSTNPKAEGVVLLAHGDAESNKIWERLCQDIGIYLSANTGIKSYDYAFIEVGQSYTQEGLPAILNLYEKSSVDRVIVLGLYVSLGVKKIAARFTDDSWSTIMENEGLIKDINIFYADKSLLPNALITDWIVERATEWLNHSD